MSSIVAQLQEQQKLISNEITRSIGTGKQAEDLRNQYDVTVKQLRAALGDDAPCVTVDPILFSLFSDLSKDIVGARPSKETTSYATASQGVEMMLLF